MKRIITSLGLCLCVGFAAMAQEKTEDPAFVNKRGITLLPEAGDFSIGVDATPFLKYLGNFFNQTADNQAPMFNGVDNTIYGKYFLENDRAIRAKLTLNFGSDTYKGVVTDDELVTNDPLNANATVVDRMTQNLSSVGLSVGYEFRRGRGRVQGFYGGEVGLGYGSGKNKYEYANPMTVANQSPSTWDFDNDAEVAGTSRATEAKLGNYVSATIAGFVGVEYFFAPQISIGGEFNLGFTYASRAQSEFTHESFNGSTSQVEESTTRRGSWPEDISSNRTWKKTEAGTAKLFTQPTGTIFVMFHF